MPYEEQFLFTTDNSQYSILDDVLYGKIRGYQGAADLTIDPPDRTVTHHSSCHEIAYIAPVIPSDAPPGTVLGGNPAPEIHDAVSSVINRLRDTGAAMVNTNNEPADVPMEVDSTFTPAVVIPSTSPSPPPCMVPPHIPRFVAPPPQTYPNWTPSFVRESGPAATIGNTFSPAGDIPPPLPTPPPCMDPPHFPRVVFPPSQTYPNWTPSFDREPAPSAPSSHSWNYQPWWNSRAPQDRAWQNSSYCGCSNYDPTIT